MTYRSVGESTAAAWKSHPSVVTLVKAGPLGLSAWLEGSSTGSFRVAQLRISSMVPTTSIMCVSRKLQGLPGSSQLHISCALTDSF